MNEKIEKLYDLWARRNPKFEKHYEESVLRVLTNYGVGASETANDKGKILGAGYEPYILAFFMGLYANKKLPLSSDTKTLGYNLGYWGNLESKKGRTAYPKIREYIFAALIARTNIDLLALDRGDIEPKEVVTQLIQTMEEYANYGFAEIADRLEDRPDFFFQNTGLLSIFMSLCAPSKSPDIREEEEIEELSAADDDAAGSDNSTSNDTTIQPDMANKLNDYWSLSDTRELLRFYKNGLSLEQLAAYFDKTEDAVITQLKKKKVWK